MTPQSMQFQIFLRKVRNDVVKAKRKEGLSIENRLLTHDFEKAARKLKNAVITEDFENAVMQAYEAGVINCLISQDVAYLKWKKGVSRRGGRKTTLSEEERAARAKRWKKKVEEFLVKNPNVGKAIAYDRVGHEEEFSADYLRKQIKKFG